ncbi:hypothetical protein THASP1DRAFT_13331 [Thamnocephalis sphaerospora]|uniref:Secondary thiamine-phosphate synthase enzyme n=1 Tax=Thamnocephalis sphaerospora TaxID=78915 RepID=A0A4P9XV21_9FUNG|nr:hypothetical protein THASP1DRAFT_13331 [Thamnocephalis sphaerospora]|eukprot:RKP10107.1 hypothetical protein THASP1DRAFT_13331 [Thamnocephalis sphaerospora]
MAWYQTTIQFRARPRGMHLVTDELLSQLSELGDFRVGMANIFLQHSSASLTINENYDSDVRRDMEMIMNRIAPEDAPYRHTDEGPDDMPGHVKSSLFGCSLNIPVRDGRLALGTWQGIWLCEHRNHGGARRCVVTIQGERKSGASAKRK